MKANADAGGRPARRQSGALVHHTMKAAERQLRIRQMFESRDFLDLETLCRELEASESSVRRDLDILEQEKVLRLSLIHISIMHSQDVNAVTRMARAMNTTLFIHNAPSPASLGDGGPGYFSHSVATPTGEGVTTPMTFTRQRQIIVGNALRII